MLPLKVAATAALLAGIAGWIGHVPTTIIDAAAVCGGLAYMVTRIVIPAGRLLRQALRTYELLEHLPARLDALEEHVAAIHEPVEAVKRELGVTARGDTPPQPTPDA